jgi:25S rRNA (uracil2843-N3)-methyltransferase
MGKNGKFGKIYGKVVGKDSQDRPGWKGPGYVKKAAPAKPKKKEPDDQVLEPTIPIELQQLLLNIFNNAFPEIIGSETLQQQLQEVKAALYDRDFAREYSYHSKRFDDKRRCSRDHCG